SSGSKVFRGISSLWVGPRKYPWSAASMIVWPSDGRMIRARRFWSPQGIVRPPRSSNPLERMWSLNPFAARRSRRRTSAIVRLSAAATVIYPPAGRAMMPLDVNSHRKAFVSGLKAAARPNPKAQSYLGSPVRVLGVSVPHLRGLVAAFRRENRNLPVGDLNTLAAVLWKGAS